MNVSGENDYVVYMTEIGVQLGKGDEFANGVLKEMKAAVEKEVGIMVMIAGTVMNQPNEWLSLEVYQIKMLIKNTLKLSTLRDILRQQSSVLKAKAFIYLSQTLFQIKDKFFTVLKMILGKSVYVL